LPVGHYFTDRERQTRRRLLDADLRPPLQRLRGGQFGTRHTALFGQDLDRHQAGFFLEQQSRRRPCGLCREHEGGADIGMTGKGDLVAHGEYPNLRVVRGIFAAAA